MKEKLNEVVDFMKENKITVKDIESYYSTINSDNNNKLYLNEENTSYICVLGEELSLVSDKRIVNTVSLKTPEFSLSNGDKAKVILSAVKKVVDTYIYKVLLVSKELETWLETLCSSTNKVDCLFSESLVSILNTEIINESKSDRYDKVSSFVSDVIFGNISLAEEFRNANKNCALSLDLDLLLSTKEQEKGKEDA